MTAKAKMKLTTEQVQQFLTDHHRTSVSNIIMLSGGNWSQAFAYKQAGKDYVIRFGVHQDDYLNDQAAQLYASSDLPIPKVLEVGETFGGYFAISERAFGTMIDELDHEAMKRVMPSLFATLDAIRIADISSSTGFGGRDNNGNGTFATWREWLLDVNQDKPNSKTHGWKTGLKNSPVGSKPFEEGYESLIELSRGLPEVRSLIHNDLMNFNVLVNDDKITAMIDWANALYGDFLYELANFVFWGPIHEPFKGIDWESAALKHYKSIGLKVPMFKERLQCCMVRMGLDHLAYYGFTRDWTYLEPVAKRTLALAKGQS